MNTMRHYCCLKAQMPKRLFNFLMWHCRNRSIDPDRFVGAVLLHAIRRIDESELNGLLEHYEHVAPDGVDAPANSPDGEDEGHPLLWSAGHGPAWWKRWWAEWRATPRVRTLDDLFYPPTQELADDSAGDDV